MKISINLSNGFRGTKQSFEENISALKRILLNKKLSCDNDYLIGTISIMEGINSQLPPAFNTIDDAIYECEKPKERIKITLELFGFEREMEISTELFLKAQKFNIYLFVPIQLPLTFGLIERPPDTVTSMQLPFEYSGYNESKGRYYFRLAKYLIDKVNLVC